MDIHRHGRWDEALEVAAEAAGMAEANHIDIVAASADAITATVLALRAESGAARRHAARALATWIQRNAGWWPPGPAALGIAAGADGATSQRSSAPRFVRDDGMPRSFTSYLGVADLAAARSAPTGE